MEGVKSNDNGCDVEAELFVTLPRFAPGWEDDDDAAALLSMMIVGVVSRVCNAKCLDYY